MASITTKHVSSSRSYAIPRRLLLSYLISLILNNTNILVASSSSSRPLIRQHLRGRRHHPSLERRLRADKDMEDDYMQQYPSLGEDGGRPMGLTLQEKMKMFANHKPHHPHDMEGLEDISFEGDDMYGYPTTDDDDDNKNEHGDDFEDDVDAIVPEKTEALAAATVPNPLLGHSEGKANKKEEDGKGKDEGGDYEYEYEYEPYEYEKDEIMNEKALEIAPIVNPEENTETTMALETVVANPLHNGTKKKEKDITENIGGSDNNGDEEDMPRNEVMDESLAIIPENNMQITSQKVTNPLLTHKSGENKGHKKNEDQSIEDDPNDEIDSVNENPEDIETVSESVVKKEENEIDYELTVNENPEEIETVPSKSYSKKGKHSDEVKSIEINSDHTANSFEDDPVDEVTTESNDASVKEDTDGKDEAVVKKHKGKDNGSAEEDPGQMVKSINIIPEDVETVVSESVVKKGKHKGKDAKSVTPEEVNSSSEESSSGETLPSTDEIISIVDEKETIALPQSNLDALEELEGYKLDEERMPIDIKDAKTIADVKNEFSDLLNDDDGNMFDTQDSTVLCKNKTDVNDNSTAFDESEDDIVTDDDLETSSNETLLEEDNVDDLNATDVNTNDASADDDDDDDGDDDLFSDLDDATIVNTTIPLNESLADSEDDGSVAGDDDFLNDDIDSTDEYEEDVTLSTNDTVSFDDDLLTDVGDVLDTSNDSVINMTISLNESVTGDGDFLKDDFNSTDKYEENVTLSTNDTSSFDDDLLTDVGDVLDTSKDSIINMTIPLNEELFDSEDEFLSDDDVLSGDVNATDEHTNDNVTLPTNDVSYNNSNVTNGVNTTNDNIINITIPLNESSLPEDNEDDIIASDDHFLGDDDVNATDQYKDNVTLPINDISDTNSTTVATSNSESSSMDIDLPSPDDDTEYETKFESNLTEASQIPMLSDAPTASPSSSMTSLSSVVVSSLKEHSNVDTETKDDPYVGKWKLKKAYQGTKNHDGQKRKEIKFPKEAVIILTIASNPKEENGYNIKTTIGNSFITQWRIIENKKGYDIIEVDPIVSTRMMPPEEFQELEMFFGRLETFNTITVVDNLYMKGPEAELVCVPYEEDEDET